MNQQQRNELLKRQLRSFTPGIVEFINDQWIFFNDENDEAYPLEDYLQREMEVFRGSRWRKGFLSDLGTITLRKENLTLHHTIFLEIMLMILLYFFTELGNILRKISL